MAFTLPVFNLPVNDWYLSDSYFNPPASSGFGNLSSSRRFTTPNSPIADEGANFDLYQWFLCMADPINPGPLSIAGTSPDVLEVPAGSGLIYLDVDGVWVGRGFPNEHLALMLAPLTLSLKAALVANGYVVGVWPDFPPYFS